MTLPQKSKNPKSKIRFAEQSLGFEVFHDGGNLFRGNDQLVRALFNEAHDIIMIHGYTENNIPAPFAEVNESACLQLGYAREELLKLTVFDIVIDSDVKDIPATSKELFKSKHKIFERTFRKKSGELMSVEVNARIFYVQNKPYALSISRDITERKKRELQREKLIGELNKAFADVKKLSGLLPICSNCKKIRNDKGYWQELEIFLEEHSEAEFSHGLCRECAGKLYPDFYSEKKCRE